MLYDGHSSTYYSNTCRTSQARGPHAQAPAGSPRGPGSGARRGARLRALRAASAAPGRLRSALTRAGAGAQTLVRVVRNHLPADVFAALKTALLARLAAHRRQMPPDQDSCLFCVHVVLNVNGAPPARVPGCALAKCAGAAPLSPRARARSWRAGAVLRRRAAAAGRVRVPNPNSGRRAQACASCATTPSSASCTSTSSACATPT